MRTWPTETVRVREWGCSTVLEWGGYTRGRAKAVTVVDLRTLVFHVVPGELQLS